TNTAMPIDKVLGKLLNTKVFVFTSGEIPNAKIITNTEPGHNKPDQYELFLMLCLNVNLAITFKRRKFIFVIKTLNEFVKSTQSSHIRFSIHPFTTLPICYAAHLCANNISL
ncbi:hypothetical protein NR458_10085, partial [Pediococcus ethanolidurans]|uniref:hypothetical protein n=1 Tax=Pediococcus ethanolidurans TaxID=319653 RepID=UPI0021E74E7C